MLSFKVPWEETCKGQMSFWVWPLAALPRDSKGRWRNTKGWTTDSYSLWDKNVAEDTRGSAPGAENHTPGVSQSSVEAKSHTEPGVFKENPKTNQPVLKVFCDCFPPHRENTVFSSSRSAPWTVTTGGWWGERKQRGGLSRRRDRKRGGKLVRHRGGRGGSKGTALCSADRHTAPWPLCAPGGRTKGAPTPVPTTPTIEGPLSTSPLTASVSHLQNGESE